MGTNGKTPGAPGINFCVCLGIPSTGCVKYLYIEKELIPAVWKVFLILVITSVLGINSFSSIVKAFLSFLWDHARTMPDPEEPNSGQDAEK